MLTILDTPPPLPISTGAPQIHSFGHPIFPLPNTTGPHTTYSHSFLDTPHSNTHLHGGPKIHSFGHPLIIPIPISTGAPKYTPLDTPYSHYQSTRGPHIHTLWTPLILLPIYTASHIHPFYTNPHITLFALPSYGRSTTFDYLSSFV